MRSNNTSFFHELFLPKELKGMKLYLAFIKRLSIIMTLIIFFIYIITKVLPLDSIKKVDIDGNVIYFEDGQKKIYNFLFSTSEVWFNPKLQFCKGDIVTIRATGKYNSAIHHLVKYADSDTNLIYDWIGPEGIDKDEIKRPADVSRMKGLIETDENYGCLLVRTKTNNLQEYSKPYSFDPKKQEIKIEFEKIGELEFIVNEPILEDSPRSKEIYIVDSNEDMTYWTEKKEKQIEAWNNIVKNKNYSLWFDDNIGNFLITIEVENSN